jgi:hypothetical protein
MTLNLALDIVIAVLLVATIGYALKLNARLMLMRKDREALEKLAATFNAAMQRAGESTVLLKRGADDMGHRLQKAESLRDDLQFLIERGGAIADRLEQGVRAARPEAQSGPRGPRVAVNGNGAPAGANGSGTAPGAQPLRAPAKVVSARTQAERDLLRVLQAVR